MSLLTDILNRAFLVRQKPIQISNKPKIVTPGPSSRVDDDRGFIEHLTKEAKVITPDFAFEVIPLIRKLTRVTPDLGQAFFDIVKLANTGHDIKFDPKVPHPEQDRMRAFIDASSKEWHTGAAGLHGIINKMFAQIMIGGASCIEWVPNKELDNLEEVRFLLPEVIRFVRNKTTNKKKPYQKLRNNVRPDPSKDNLVPLNDAQFKYFALNGDTDDPYGIPPYLPALKPISTQEKMLQNIEFITDLLGVLGYATITMDKPNQLPGESDSDYEKRLTGLLTQLKDRARHGLRDGINVGFKDDHEFDFHSTSKEATGMNTLWDNNEQQVSSGLQYDLAFMGREGTSQTMITVLFTKMLSQLTNMQMIVAESLEYGLSLALKLHGFKFEYLKVEFRPSTISDDLKLQQAQEIKIRNLMGLYDQGIIGQDIFAEIMGYVQPDQPEPRVPRTNDLMKEAAKAETREKQKDTSDRKVRDKNKPRPDGKSKSDK